MLIRMFPPPKNLPHTSQTHPKHLKKLHPCKRTLNSRNLGLAKDSFKVSFGFRTLWRPRLIKDPKNVKNNWFYCVFAQKCKKNHWFYCVFVQTCWKTIGFIVFSLNNVEKPLVLLCFRSNMLKNHWFYNVFAKYWKSIGFTVFLM